MQWDTPSKMNHILKREVFLFPSLYRFPGGIHSLASFTRWNNAAFIGFGFSVLQDVEGSEITSHTRRDHEASMNLFLGKIWHLKVHYENHIIYFIYIRVQSFFGRFNVPWTLLYMYIHIISLHTYLKDCLPARIYSHLCVSFF